MERIDPSNHAGWREINLYQGEHMTAFLLCENHHNTSIYLP